MLSSNLFVGALAFAAGAVTAGPCRPKPTTSGAADTTTTIATSSVTESILVSTDSFTFALSSTDFTDVTTTVTASETSSTGTTDTLTSSDSVSADSATTTTTESIDLTTTLAETTTTTAETTTTTAEATTTTSEADPAPTFSLFAIGSADPSLSVSGGIGFAELESFRNSDSVFYFDFTNNAASTQTFTIDQDSGAVTALNGPGSAAGESVFYSTSAGLVPYSVVNFSTRQFAEAQGGEQVVCRVAPGQGYEYLQCNWGQNQIADFWTCNKRLNLVRPGFDFTSQCSDATTSYKIPIIQVIRR
ncbi:hypothetical protein NW762_013817 [Fusarium torreyae]|uniref:Uncharacterized protein n=1 Tax=Fusarium torreyae TaxID=1237075 RepID=A0A9W8RNQ2_9HYPO|nr:hypothetical protein NW762_013817 [Fusarium torreyae]